MEQGIDLAKYIEILLRRWYLVIIPSVICAVVTALVVLSLPRLYQAKAMVIALRSTALVSYNTAITTSSQEANTAASASQRLVSLAALVHSPEVASVVLATLGDRLPMQSRSVSALYNMVESEIMPKSDLISIQVTNSDRQLATEIADIWATECVSKVNTLYASADTESYTAIQREVPIAKDAYEAAQASLEKQLKENPLGELVHQSNAISATIVMLNNTRLGAARDQLAEIQRTDMLLQAAQGLYNQIKAGGFAAGQSSNLALSVLKLQAFGGLPNTQALVLPLQVQTGTVSSGTSDLLQDTESLVAVLQAQRLFQSGNLRKAMTGVQQGNSWILIPGTTDQAVTPEEQGSSLDDNLDKVLLGLENQLRDRYATSEQVSSQLRQATAERDLAWETYSNLVRKEAELKLAIATAGAEVRLGSLSVASALDNNLRRNVILAATAGLLFGALLALVREHMVRYRARVKVNTDDASVKLS